MYDVLADEKIEYSNKMFVFLAPLLHGQIFIHLWPPILFFSTKHMELINGLVKK